MTAVATLPRLAALNATEAAGITFSFVSMEHGELGVFSFQDNETGRKAARDNAVHAKITKFGLVPRTQAAVDVMTEVLS